MNKIHKHIPYLPNIVFDEQTLLQKSETYFKHLNSRRSLRFFSAKNIPKEVIENIIMTASTAP